MHRNNVLSTALPTLYSDKGGKFYRAFDLLPRDILSLLSSIQVALLNFNVLKFVEFILTLN